VVAVEPEVDEAAEVDRCDAGGEAVLVAFDAAVADAAVAFGDEPRDRPFHHGSPLSVVVGEVALGSGLPGGDEQRVVGVDREMAATGC